MEGSQKFTPWSHPGSCPLRPSTQTDALTLATARQDPQWHEGVLTFYSIITPKLEPSGFFFAQIIVPTSPWPWHECHTSPPTPKDICPCIQTYLPSQSKAFASTTQGICLQNSCTHWHLPAKTRCDMKGFQLLTARSHKNRVQWVFLFFRTKHSSAFALTPTWMSFRRRPHCKLAKWSLRMPRTSTTTPAGLSLDLCSLQRLSMNTNIDSFSFIIDPTSLHIMKVGELLKDFLGHIRQFQGKVMSGGGQNGVLAEERLGYDLISRALRLHARTRFHTLA